jgi:hypothetical protein
MHRERRLVGLEGHHGYGQRWARQYRHDLHVELHWQWRHHGAFCNGKRRNRRGAGREPPGGEHVDQLRRLNDADMVFDQRDIVQRWWGLVRYTSNLG